MRPAESEREFKRFVRAARKSPKVITAEDAVKLVLGFYSEIRAGGCSLEDDGDMLLYQWSYRERDGRFCFDITRQFILEGSRDDDGMSQLSFSLYFPATDSLRKIEDGNLWCKSPAELESFREFILNSEVYSELKEQTAASTELYWCGI